METESPHMIAVLDRTNLVKKATEDKPPKEESSKPKPVLPREGHGN